MGCRVKVWQRMVFMPSLQSRKSFFGVLDRPAVTGVAFLSGWAAILRDIAF
ncbi:hypothetical protein DSUL_60032 [Desulfovibrionales bacterium]